MPKKIPEIMIMSQRIMHSSRKSYKIPPGLESSYPSQGRVMIVRKAGKK